MKLHKNLIASVNNKCIAAHITYHKEGDVCLSKYILSID